MTRATLTQADLKRSLWSGVLLGIGLMAAVDEIVFHQVLGWHHFYDRSTLAVGLFSDGLLHASELIAIVAGMFMVADLIRARTLASSFLWAGLFLGLSAFQLFDGLVDHKVLRLHQVRYGVPLLAYDVIWNLAGLVLLLIGVALWRRASQAREARR